MNDPTWKDYRLFEFDELVENVMNPPPIIAALVSGSFTRGITEKAMLPTWLTVCRTIHHFERENFHDHVDLGGESG